MDTPKGERGDLRALLERVSNSAFSGNMMEFAAALLGWSARIPFGGVGGLDASLLSAGHLDRFRSAFCRDFQDSHPRWAREDIDAAWGLCLRHCTNLSDWYRLIIGSVGLTVRFDGREPEVPIEHARDWNFIADRLDTDAIVALLFAEQGSQQPVDRLDDWPLVTRIGEHDLGVVLAHGISDLHVHIGGIRSASVQWRRALRDPGSIRFLARYSPRALDKLLPDERDALVKERAVIDAVLKDLWDGTAELSKCWRPPREDGRDLGALIKAEARAERQMLVAAWRRLVDLGSAGSPPAGLPLQAAYELEFQFDRYLYAKHVFLKHHRQPEKTNPGLARFRDYYRTTERLSPKGRASRDRLRNAPRAKQRELAEYAAYVAQSAPLRRLELRMAPPGNLPADYHRFFKLWKDVEEKFGLLADGREVKFAIHFKRSMGAETLTVARLAKFLCTLDRETAALHAYRRKSAPPWDEHVDRISRVDFAGQERDLPVHLASFCMNLVRGRPDALKALCGAGIHPSLHRFWLTLQERGEATQRIGRQKLGVTCHSGEDFAHPLEGIYSVASAVETLQMEAGDTIGHGLALGADIAKFDAQNSPTRLTSRGSQFDALLWLLFELEDQDGGHVAGDTARLRDFLLAEARALYARAASGLTVLEQLRGLCHERVGPMSDRARSPRDLVARMRQAECADAVCVARRAERVPIDAVVRKLSAEITRAQEKVRSALSEKGVILEFNPSSNLRISGGDSIAQTPFVAIISLLQTKCLATVNTDNPGVFGTRIENEYALVSSALKDAGFGRAGTLEVIERLRRVGMEFVWWPKTGRPDASPGGDRVDASTQASIGPRGNPSWR